MFSGCGNITSANSRLDDSPYLSESVFALSKTDKKIIANYTSMANDPNEELRQEQRRKELMKKDKRELNSLRECLFFLLSKDGNTAFAVIKSQGVGYSGTAFWFDMKEEEWVCTTKYMAQSEITKYRMTKELEKAIIHCRNIQK